MSPITLMSSEGDALVTLSAFMDDSQDECIFIDKEFSEEKRLVFRSVGSFKYVVENKTDIPLNFTLEDTNGKIMNTSDFVGPKSKTNIHCHSAEEKLLVIGEKNNEVKPFKFTVKNLAGEWKLCDGSSNDKPKNIKETPGISSTFSFFHVLYKNIIFINQKPKDEKEKEYIENSCCICLQNDNPEEELCTLVKCGHRCVHMNCFFCEGTPNFTKCPLCRSSIIAITA